MRRTEQEFKAEVLRRSEVYRRAQAEKRKKLIGIGVCTCLCMAIFLMVTPLRGVDKAVEAPMMLMDVEKAESAVSNQSMSAKEEMPAEYEAAPMAPEEAMGAPKFDPSMTNQVTNEPDHDTGDRLPAVQEPHEERIPVVELGKGCLVIVLNDADAELIAAYLTGDWETGAANCLYDYTITVDTVEYYYHSDCGTVQDGSGSEMTLNEHDRLIVNEILQSYLE